MKRESFLKSNRGQGSIEYIMLLLIVVMISLGALYQLNTAFADYAENYFGEYLACLLETGELPNLGAPNGTTCDSEFEPFDLASGRRRIMPNTQGSGEVPPTETVNIQAQVTVQGGGRRSRRPPRLQSRGPSRVAGAVPEAKEKQEVGAAKKKTEFRTPSVRQRSFSNTRVGVSKIPTRLTASVSPLEKDEGQLKEKNAKDVDDGSSGRDKKLRIKKKTKAEVPEESEPFTFTKFIKYLLIIGIIIAIVVFLGGQILQFTKDSGE